MTTDTLTGETWRFHVNEHDGTITRGRLYQMDPSLTSDQWQWYWDGDFTVAFIDEGWRGMRGVTVADDVSDVVERVMNAFGRSGRNAMMLDRMARVIAASEDVPHPETARFIVVHLDRGTDLYALSYDGDPEREWRDEIEGVYDGVCYRIECEEYQPGSGPGGTDWIAADMHPEEWHVEGPAQAAFTREFPLAGFPADLVITGSGE